MKPSICFKNIWFDDDMVELSIIANDGNSKFENKVYVGYQQLKDTSQSLNTFKRQVCGGILNLEFGAFGPEYASGAFYAHLHFQERGKIYISVKMQSEFFDFGKKNIASEASLYLISEPALLDNFINKFKSLKDIGNSAILECVEMN